MGKNRDFFCENEVYVPRNSKESFDNYMKSHCYDTFEEKDYEDSFDTCGYMEEKSSCSSGQGKFSRLYEGEEFNNMFFNYPQNNEAGCNNTFFNPPQNSEIRMVDRCYRRRPQVAYNQGCGGYGYNYNNYGYNYNYGQDNGWWIIIIILFFFCGGCGFLF